MIIYFKALAKETGKTWVMHIAVFIAPRMVLRCAARLGVPVLHTRECTTCSSTDANASRPYPCCRWGKLWDYSSAKLESRGKKMKKIARKKVSWRPFEAEGKICKKKSARKGKACKRYKKHGDKDFYVTKGYNNYAMRSLVSNMTAMELRRLSLNATGKAKKQREQLVNLGKLERNPTVKTDMNVPERWAGLVPQGVDFTVEGLLAAMAKGVMKPLYDSEGHATKQ